MSTFSLKVISGHTGWVRCVAVEPGNKWFCTGSADRTIKVIFTCPNPDSDSGMQYISRTGPFFLRNMLYFAHKDMVSHALKLCIFYSFSSHRLFFSTNKVKNQFEQSGSCFKSNFVNRQWICNEKLPVGNVLAYIKNA